MKVKRLKRSYFEKEVEKNIVEATTVLDIGCGISPQRLVKPLIHICCEPYGEYLDKLRDKLEVDNDRNYMFLQATWQEAVKIFPPKSVDSIFLLDVIEHLEKSEARRLIKKTEKIAKKQIVIFTTLGFIPQHHEDGKDAWGLGGGVWQEHKSGWKPEDFGDGWDVFACKNFHATDNMGNPLKGSSGALYAIKNYNVTQDRFADKLNSLYFKAMEAHSYSAIWLVGYFLKSWAASKKIIWFCYKNVIRKKIK